MHAVWRFAMSGEAVSETSEASVGQEAHAQPRDSTTPRSRMRARSSGAARRRVWGVTSWEVLGRKKQTGKLTIDVMTFSLPVSHGFVLEMPTAAWCGALAGLAVSRQEREDVGFANEAGLECDLRRARTALGLYAGAGPMILARGTADGF